MSKESVVGERRAGVRVSSVPPFAEWIADKPEIAALPEKNQQYLHHVVQTRDAAIIRVNGELRRFCRVPTIDVYFKTPTTIYKLKERRTELIPEGDMDDALAKVKRGDMSGVIVESERPNGNSISERSKLNGERRDEATIRALKEELFTDKLREVGEVNFPHLDEVLKENLVYYDQKVNPRGPYENGNGIQGLPVTYFLLPASITFTENMPVPIDVVDGVPQPLYEKEEGKYINIFHWVPVEKTL